MPGDEGTAGLGIFARLPVPGKVKSRLAASIGPEAATQLYRAFAEECFAQASRCKDVEPALFNSVAEETEECREWIKSLGLEMPVAAQVESPDLGDRMAAAMGDMLRGGACKAIIVGSDIPDVSAEILSAAAAALDTAEMVLGPACDGGYYLIGLTRVPDGLLTGISWSTETVFRDTVLRAEKAGLRVAAADSLPVLQDIDFKEDLEAWCCQPENRTRAKEALRNAARSTLMELVR